MKKVILLLTIAFCGSVFAQTRTVTFKPGAAAGKDAIIENSYGYIKNSNVVPLPREDVNFGNHSEFTGMDWTYYALGCPRATHRTLFKFDELSTIPQGAVIISAELKLYGLQASGGLPGNQVAGGVFSSNESLILRVTSDWDEQTVTWNTQPATTTQNQIAVPQTLTEYDWNFTNNSNNLVAMIQDMVSNPETNFGFMLKLDTEAYYRKIVFASSDHANPALHPELTVTYNEYDCDVNFSYTVNVAMPNLYIFMASDLTATSHTWKVDGTALSYQNVFAYILPAGTHEICYTGNPGGNECTKCITLNAGGQGALRNAGLKNVKQEDLTNYDAILSGNIINKPAVFPNPTNAEWNVEFDSGVAGNATVVLSDMSGKIVFNKDFAVEAGKNSLKIDAKELLTGNYVLMVNGEGIKLSEVLIKN